MESIILLSRLFLVAIFATAGVTKLLDPKGSQTAVRDFGVPDAFVKPFSYILPISEIVVALLIFPLATAWIGALAALFFLAWFTIGMAYQMAKGRAPDCHCFGQLHTEPVSAKSLVRNGIFAIPAIFLVARGIGGQGPSFADLTIYRTEFVFGLLIVAMLAGMLLVLKRILENQAIMLRRIEVIEVMAADGGSVKREEAGNPEDGLPIGAVFPDFDLSDARGRIVTYEDILAERKPSIFFLVSPTCQPCAAMVPEILDWYKHLGDKINFKFITRGTGDENMEKFPGISPKDILLQDDREVQEKIFAKWTPSALFVNIDGRVASHLATGDSAIRTLVKKIDIDKLTDPFFFIAGDNANGRAPKIGENIPEFELNDREGRTIASSELLGKTTLVTFWSPTCSHCAAMIDQIKVWETNRSEGDPDLLLFSDGEAEAHSEIDITSPIVVDRSFATAGKFGMFGTPSAVLVDENGLIVSETAVGAVNIWSLIGRTINN